MPDIFYVEGYCRNEDCLTRNVTMLVKDYEDELDVGNMPELVCPFCRQHLTIHEVLTRQKHYERTHRQEMADALDSGRHLAPKRPQ